MKSIRRNLLIVISIVLIIGIGIGIRLSREEPAKKGGEIVATETPGDNQGETLTDEEILSGYFPTDYIGYRYSVLPGMTTWPYGNHQEMIDACQIPETVIAQMSTEELLQSVIVYPLFGDIYAYDNLADGFEAVKEYFYGLQELCARSGRVECLFDYVSAHRDWYQENSTVTGNEYFDHLRVAFRRNIGFLAGSEDFRINEQGEETSVVDFLNEALTNSTGMRTEENRDATPTTYLWIEGMVEDTYQTVYTPRGAPMSAVTYKACECWRYSDGNVYYRIMNDLSAEGKADCANSMYALYSLYPDSGRNATVKYNCHSYAWYSTSSNNTNWIESFNTTNYILTTLQSVNVGEIVVYCDSYGGNVNSGTLRTHSALVISKIYHPVHQNVVEDLSMKSKWGRCGVYSHNFANCPYYKYRSTNYISDRLYYN